MAQTSLKTLGFAELILFNVCAIATFETLTASAGLGFAGLFWYVATFVVFFIPYAGFISELGATYPDEGGLYVWVKRAFGRSWGSRIAWMYWIAISASIAPTYVFWMGMLKVVFVPEMSGQTFFFSALAMIWLTVIVNVLPLNFGKWISNIGGLVSIATVIALSVGAVNFLLFNEWQNEPLAQNFFPENLKNLKYWAVIPFNFLGFEMMCAAAREMNVSGLAIRKIVLLSGFGVLLFYVVGMISILAVLPAESISLTQDVMIALQVVIMESGLPYRFFLCMAVMLLISMLAYNIVWTFGSNRIIREAAKSGYLPKFLSIEHSKWRTPLAAAISCAGIGTACLLFYPSSKTEDIFWKLFSFTAVLFNLPYFGIPFVWARLRKIDPHAHRPYSFRVGNVTFWVFSTILILCLTISTLFFLYDPSFPFSWTNGGILTLGVLGVIGFGEFFIVHNRIRQN